MSSCYGQTIDLEKEIMLSPGNISIDKILQQVSEQSKIRFSFNPKELNVSELIRIPRTPMSIRNVLIIIIGKKPISYRVLGMHLVFQPSKARPSRIKPTRTLSKMSNTAAPISVRSVATPIISPTNDTVYEIKPPRLVFLKLNPKKEIQHSIKFRDKPRVKVMVRAGLRADDVFYSGIELQAGLPQFYALISWVTNYDVAGFRYGIGSTFNLSNDWKLGISFNTGKLSKAYSLDTLRIQSIIKLRQFLHRFTISIEKRFDSRLAVQVGPLFNFLKTTYYYDGTRQALSGVVGIRTDIDDYYRPIRPVYLLSNNFSSSSAGNNKLWIGLQLNILYTIW